MAKLIAGVVLFILFVIFAPISCTVIEPGYVGIKVQLNGTQKGVADYPIYTGRQFYNQYTQKFYEWPTFTQRVVWDKGGEDGRDDSITVRSSEGTSVNLDISLAYRVIPEKVPHIFVTFRQDIDALSNGYLRDKVRDTVNNHAAKIGVMQLLGPGMQKLTDDVLAELREVLRPQGFIIDSVSVTGKPRVDGNVEAAINQVVQATQAAIKAEQDVRRVQAEAAQAKAKAEGVASAITAEAEAQAKANKIIAESLNQYGEKVLESKMLDKWDGKLPQIVGGNQPIPFINVK
jgi:regulator of protease activity HflC (stomatin/prohibitin superfamily)